MGEPNEGAARPGRSLTYVVIGMVVGLVFLMLSCGLLAWSYLVAPVPRSMAIVAAVLGAVSATVILASIVVYALRGSPRPQE